MAIVIGDYNRKGGVGKTSSIINLAAEFALCGKKVLLIDGDSQTNLTQFFFSEDEELFDGGRIRGNVDTLYQVLQEGIDIRDAIMTKEFSARRKWRNKFRKISCTLDIIMGSREMDYYDNEDMEILKKKLSVLEEDYDYILIDFPPAHNLVTMTYLLACDYVIVPLHLAKDTSTYGYEDVIERCREARNEYGNRNLQVLGLFYINVQLYKDDQKILYELSMEEEMRNAMRLFETTIKHDYGAMQMSESEKKPLCITSGSSEIARNYKALAKEIEKRIEEERGL